MGLILDMEMLGSNTNHSFRDCVSIEMTASANVKRGVTATPLSEPMQVMVRVSPPHLSCARSNNLLRLAQNL